MAFQVGDVVRVIGDTACTGETELMGQSVMIISIDDGCYYIDWIVNGDPEHKYFLYAADMELVQRGSTGVIRVGDRVVRFRGGEHSRMKEGDEGVVARIWESSRGTELVAFEGLGATGYDLHNYRKIVTSKFFGNTEPRHVFKPGDRVVIVDMTSGLGDTLKKHCGKVISNEKIITSTGKKFITVSLDIGRNVDLWTTDIRLAVSPIQTNFKAYVKERLSANVADGK